MYGLNLFAGKLDASVNKPIDVIMLNQLGEVKQGKIINTTYTMKPQGIHNTLAIVDCVNVNSKINEEGNGLYRNVLQHTLLYCSRQRRHQSV